MGHRLVYDLGKERNGKKTIMSKIISSLETILAIFAFFYIFLSVAAIIGMQLYGGQFDFPDGYFRENFDTFPRSLLTMFQVCQLFHASGYSVAKPRTFQVFLVFRPKRAPEYARVNVLQCKVVVTDCRSPQRTLGLL